MSKGLGFLWSQTQESLHLGARPVGQILFGTQFCFAISKIFDFHYSSPVEQEASAALLSHLHLNTQYVSIRKYRLMMVNLWWTFVSWFFSVNSGVRQIYVNSGVMRSGMFWFCTKKSTTKSKKISNAPCKQESNVRPIGVNTRN
jgi:hypothetical protein